MAVSDILTDVDLTIDLIAKLIGSIAEAKAVLSTDQIADARARLAQVQQQGAALDAAFDAALQTASGA